ncbi:MAG: transglycosylase SLT domain-containing protein [Epsilonproteobacteria bacterium]|nr:transglycosylase SLT domain-containing protein [Campylobacterota bacterium]
MFIRAVFGMLFMSILLPLYAQKLTLAFFEDKPRSLLKDFYISQFLDQNISSKEAQSLIGDVHNMNYRLFYQFTEKIDDFSFKRTRYCLKLDANKYLGKSSDCIAMGLTPYKASTLSPKTLQQIAKDIQETYPTRALAYTLIAEKSFTHLLQADPKTALYTFNSVGSKFRATYYNQTIPADKLIELAKHNGFNTMISKIVRDPKLTNLQQSILKLDASALNANSNFLLALNAIKQDREDVAIWYLKLAASKARLQFDKDKALFWHYLISQDKKLLHTLIASKDINLYTLYAQEKLGVTPKNIYTSILPQQKKAPFKVKDPFAWIKFYQMFNAQSFPNYEARKTAAIQYNSVETEAHVAKLIYKFSENKHYFLKPYFETLSTLPKKRAALILALARQESRFIPTVVSYSYALGMMQFMPYVAKDLAKKHGFTSFRYENMFDPKTAYQFANIHLDFLEKSLYHPLLVAYAYNGGIGYTKRQILQKGYFKEGKYEPYLSMEMLQNGQAREYGKKVLANYLVYSKLLGLKLSLTTLFDSLKPPTRIHRF